MKKPAFIIGQLIVAAATIYAQQSDFPKLSEPYLGQKPPSDIPEVFAKGIISLENRHEYCLSITPDGREIYFSRAGDGIMVCSWLESEWTSPKKTSFGEVYIGGEVHYT
jgi:hypothetical protein